MAETGRRPPPNAPAQNDTQSASDIQSTESRMRRALGLTSSAGSHVAQQRPEQARQRHRFVQDGGVPVVMLGHKPEPETAALRERIAALEAALDVERSAHGTTKRALQEQLAAAQALQTRLAHRELAHNEALEAERRLRLVAQQATLAAQSSAPPTARAVPSIGRGRPVDAAVRLRDEPALAAAAPSEPARRLVPAALVEKPKRGRPRINPPPEPKPLRWWTPSFRARTKG